MYWGYTLFVIATGLIVLGVSYGWPRLTDSPQPRATSIMLALFGLAGLFAAWQDDTAPYLDWLPVLAGLGLLWTFVQNLTRGMGASGCGRQRLRAGRRRRHRALREHLGRGGHRARGQGGDRRRPRRDHRRPVHDGAAVAGDLHLPARGRDVDGGRRHHVRDHPRQQLHVADRVILGAVMGLLVAGVDRMLGLIAYAQYQAANLELSQNIELKRNVEKARSFAVQLALGAAPIALGGVVVYALERIAL